MTHKRGSDFNFTENALAALKIPATGRDFYRDSGTAGLTLIVRPSGAKTFSWYRKVAGRPWSERLGDFPNLSIDAARAAASDRNAKLSRWMADGSPKPSPFTRAPKPEAPPKELTLSALVEIYIERYLRGHAKRPERAEKDLRQMVDFHCPEWKTRPLAKITAEDVSLKHQKIGAKGTKLAANRMVERIRTLFNYARGNALFAGKNPALYKHHGLPGVERFDENPRTRYLLEEEMPAFWAALDADDNEDFRDYILFSFFTAARRGDVFSMRWADIDLMRATWTVPKPKRKKPYTIALVDKVLEALKRRAESRVPENPWVFPGVGKSGHMEDFKLRWRALLVQAKLDYPNGGRERPTLHDIRRSFATHAMDRGVPLPIISEMLGHRDVATTAKAYAHVLKKAQADATQATATVLDGMRGKPLLEAPAPVKVKALKPAKATLRKRKARPAGKTRVYKL